MEKTTSGRVVTVELWFGTPRVDGTGYENQTGLSQGIPTSVECIQVSIPGSKVVTEDVLEDTYGVGVGTRTPGVLLLTPESRSSVS